MKIEILYPEIANLYGDLENPKYLARSCGAELVFTALGDTPAFVNEDISLVYLGSTTEKGQLLIRDALLPYSEALHKRVNNGGVTLITGNAVELFGEYIEDENGIKQKMLSWFPTYAKRDILHRYNSFCVGSFKDIKIVGFQSKFSHIYGENKHPLFNLERGGGNNPDESAEGFRINNFMATCLLGPLMILNPFFAKYMLGVMGAPGATKLAFEEAAMDAYYTRLDEFFDSRRKGVL